MSIILIIIMNIREKQVANKYDQLAVSYHDLRTKKNPNGWFSN